MYIDTDLLDIQVRCTRRLRSWLQSTATTRDAEGRSDVPSTESSRPHRSLSVPYSRVRH